MYGRYIRLAAHGDKGDRIIAACSGAIFIDAATFFSHELAGGSAFDGLEFDARHAVLVHFIREGVLLQELPEDKPSRFFSRRIS